MLLHIVILSVTSQSYFYSPECDESSLAELKFSLYLCIQKFACDVIRCHLFLMFFLLA